MEKLTVHRGLAAPLMRDNIDTDLLIPSREMTHPYKDGYGDKLLSYWRYNQFADGTREENPDFVLNRPAFRHSSILLTGRNFGSGSSREAAAWAVRQFGFRCVIAKSIGTIFQNNCFRNGILPIVLPEPVVEELAQSAASGRLTLTVDLERSTICAEDDRSWSFTVPESERMMLLEGLDATALTLRSQEEIQSFQREDRLRRPWIWNTIQRSKSVAEPGEYRK